MSFLRWPLLLIFFAFAANSHADLVGECEALLRLMPADVATEKPLSFEEINYEYFENPHATETIVLIHGMDSAFQTFTPIIQGLKGRFNVLIYDQRGHGKTLDRGFNYTSQLLARDLLTLVDGLQIPKFHILGHSFGARTAMRFSHLFPERILSIIVEDMEMIKRQDFPVDQMIETGRQIATFPQEFGSEEELVADFKKLYGPNASPPPTRVRRNGDGSATLLFKPYVGYLYGRQAVMEDFTEALNQVSVPILLMRADRGSAVSEKGYSHFLAHAPQAKVVTIPGSVHNVHGSQPEIFLRTLIDFVDGTRKATPL